jgi:DNA-binding GntR family transcriptional regulator
MVLCRQKVYNPAQSLDGCLHRTSRGSALNVKPSRQEIHRQLREQILLLDLAPGSRLREEHLARHFGVSRTPIRQVLDRLEFEGLVEQGDGTGARVSALDPKELRDIWAMRLRIAQMVGEFMRIPKDQTILDRLDSIRSQLAEVKESRDLRDLGALYNRYHETMLSLIGNQALVRIHDLLYVQTARVWNQFLPEMDLDREIDVMAEEVGETMAALAEGSLQQVAEVRAEHMRRLLNRFNQQMTNLPAVSALTARSEEK